MGWYSALGSTTSSSIRTLRLSSPTVSDVFPRTSCETGLTHHQSSMSSERGRSGTRTTVTPRRVGRELLCV